MICQAAHLGEGRGLGRVARRVARILLEGKSLTASYDVGPSTQGVQTGLKMKEVRGLKDLLEGDDARLELRARLILVFGFRVSGLRFRV